MSKQENIETQTRFGDAINSGDFDAFDALVAANSVDNDPAPGQVSGPDGYKSFFGDMRTAFPDLNVAVEHLVADDDSVAFAYTLTGTNSGPFQGNEPTGRSITVRGMQISRFEGGVMVERWGATDEVSIMKQLGLLPA
jgi:steroid delta-isomerase-like uncharacterized protein